eukprot:sb/3466695/
MKRDYLLLVLLIIGFHIAIQVECDGVSNCNITEIGPFLTEICPPLTRDEIVFRCPNSNDTFTAYTRYSLALRLTRNMVTKLCPNDSAHYQACLVKYLDDYHRFSFFNGFNIRLFDSPPVCGRLCWNNESYAYQFTDDQQCPEDHATSIVSEASSTWYVPPRAPTKAFLIPSNLVCDGKCDYVNKDLLIRVWRCVDEIDCHGLSYGIVIPESGIFPLNLDSDFITQTMMNNTEKYCEHSHEFVGGERRLYPLNNRTRCFYMLQYQLFGNEFDSKQHYDYPYCLNGHDQTNCSYSGFVAGQCKVDGFPTTISIHILCGRDMPILCDEKK